MMARKRKTSDPQLIAWKDELANAGDKLDRWWTKVVRAVNQCRKLVSKVKWIERKIREREAELELPREGGGSS